MVAPASVQQCRCWESPVSPGSPLLASLPLAWTNSAEPLLTATASYGEEYVASYAPKKSPFHTQFGLSNDQPRVKSHELLSATTPSALSWVSLLESTFAKS